MLGHNYAMQVQVRYAVPVQIILRVHHLAVGVSEGDVLSSGVRSRGVSRCRFALLAND
jgi:hypothetical protein